MPISTTTEIAAPAARVWSILIDTEAWPIWGPSLNRVESSGRFIAVGSRGRVRTALGIWLPFEVLQFADGRYWSWKVAGIPATGHRVEPLGVDGCRLSFDVPVLAAPYLVVCTAACRRIRTMAEAAA
ncbi:MAG: SRPBCC family protein [Gammaproteobacteria bacterium]|jgi:hypothetical protein